MTLKESIFAERVQNRCEGIDRVLDGDCSGSDDVVAVAGVHASDGGLHLVLWVRHCLTNILSFMILFSYLEKKPILDAPAYFSTVRDLKGSPIMLVCVSLKMCQTNKWQHTSSRGWDANLVGMSPSSAFGAMQLFFD